MRPYISTIGTNRRQALAEEIREQAALREDAVRIRVQRQRHGFLAEIDSIQAQGHDPHPPELDTQHRFQHLVIARCDRLWGQDQGASAKRQPPPWGKAAVGGHGQALQ